MKTPKMYTPAALRRIAATACKKSGVKLIRWELQVHPQGARLLYGYVPKGTKEIAELKWEGVEL